MTTTTAPSTRITGRLQERIDAFFAGIGQGVNAYIERESHMHEIQRLDAKSDAELQAMGLRREDIPRHVFRGLFPT